VARVEERDVRKDGTNAFIIAEKERKFSFSCKKKIRIHENATLE
jgi:hypothetical protein